MIESHGRRGGSGAQADNDYRAALGLCRFERRVPGKLLELNSLPNLLPPFGLVRFCFFQGPLRLARDDDE